MKIGHSAALFIAVLTLAQAAQGQDVRKMQFVIGARQQALRIELAYHDPADIDARLTGSRVLPFKLTASNVSSQPVPLDYADIKLNLNGNQTLTPVAPNLVADEIRRMNGKFPALLNFLSSQSSTFHRSNIEKKQLRNGVLRPGEKKEGFIFFLRADGRNAQPFNGVMWLEPAGYPPQVLETKAVSVKTAPKLATADWIRQIWESVVSGELPYKKNYALLVGIGKYKYLPPLSSPSLDVKKMEAFLLDQGFDEVVTVTDETVTTEMIQAPQKYFTSKIQPDDRFLFYYSGHGLSVVQGGQRRGYLPLVNERDKSHSNSIAMDDLVSWMNRLTTDRLLVIMDACFSGLAVEGIETHSADRAVVSSLSMKPARYLLMAGTEDQESIANGKWNGSLFTEMIIRGVQKAKFDDPRFDRIISTNALYAWVRLNVSNEAQKVNRELTPLLKDLSPRVSRGEFVFFRR